MVPDESPQIVPRPQCQYLSRAERMLRKTDVQKRRYPRDRKRSQKPKSDGKTLREREDDALKFFETANIKPPLSLQDALEPHDALARDAHVGRRALRVHAVAVYFSNMSSETDPAVKLAIFLSDLDFSLIPFAKIGGLGDLKSQFVKAALHKLQPEEHAAKTSLRIL